MGSNPAQGNYSFPQKLSSVEFPVTLSLSLSLSLSLYIYIYIYIFFFFSFSVKVWPVGVGKLCSYLFVVFISSDHCLNASRLSKPYKASLPLQLCAFTRI